MVLTDLQLPNVVDASGRLVRACGAIDLTWMWHPQGTRANKCRFYVLSESSDHLDVIFGVEFLESQDLVQVNESVMLPLIQDKKTKERK